MTINSFKNNALRCRLFALASVTLSLFISSTAYAAATLVIANIDGAGVGFNDATVVAPIGGNTGTTLGQQRLNAFQEAANIWGATLTSTVTITIRAQWTALTCTASSAVLGSAGAVTINRNFSSAPFTNTWYSASLANKLAGSDLGGAGAANPEINANFNVNLGAANCLAGSPFYLGLDGNHGAGIDLVAVLLHEFSHGLGFQTFTNSSTGAQNAGVPMIYDRFLMDLSSGKSWLQMTNAERAASAINPRKLAWNGPKVQSDGSGVLSLGKPLLNISSPALIAGSYDVGVAAFGPLLTAGGLTGDVVQALDGVGTSTDGCTALTNGAAVSGKIALIDRGTCGFTVKVINAQTAGAIAVIIVDNVAGGPPDGLGGSDPTVTIPSVRVTQDVGNTIKAQLAGGVNGTLLLDITQRSGADSFGKVLMYSPNPVQSGSSVSHWDTSAFPNQLMEPSINGDLTHNVAPPSDLTFSQLQDIGWAASALPNTIVTSAGNNQTAPGNQNFVVAPSVTATPAVAGLTVSWTVNPGGNGASATFPGTGTRFAVSTTNASGGASAPPLTANGTAGAYAMNATIAGAGTATFMLTNALARVLDIDDNQAYDAATDGVLLLRYLFGLRGSALTANGALGAGASLARTTEPALTNYLAAILPQLDVDANTKVDALTDGLMILRSLLGLTGTAITQNAMGVGFTRPAVDVPAYIQTLKP